MKTSITMFGLNNRELAYFLLRLGLGINLFFHGVVRIPKLSGFVGAMEGKFAETLLPGFMVTPLAYLIPLVEFGVGLMLILGLKTKEALVGVSGLMMLLIMGCCFAQDWGPINSQIILLILSAILIVHLPLNRFALTREA